jgi:GntR family transcriptional regulator
LRWQPRSPSQAPEQFLHLLDSDSRDSYIVHVLCTMKRNAPLLRIDLASETPAYAQIVDELRSLLVSCELQPGDVLPPVRQLAADLTVHHNTVALAYRKLCEEGWLDLRRGRGARVCERAGRRPDHAAGDRFSRQLRQLVARALGEGLPVRAVERELKRRARGCRRPKPAEGD